jgi:ATP-binding cassette, subfamily B, bacterial HlyB/CyaB
MSQQISADAEQGCTSAATPTADAPDTPRPESQTALECLARIAAHHGVDLPVERLRHAYAVDGAPISQTLLLRMAKEAGLRARTTRLDWGTLFRLGEAYPALVRLANGNWIIVSGAGEGPGGEEQVRVIDPLAERQHEPLIVGKDRFCATATRS